MTDKAELLAWRSVDAFGMLSPEATRQAGPELWRLLDSKSELVSGRAEQALATINPTIPVLIDLGRSLFEPPTNTPAGGSFYSK
jgi:hypothetical protein